MHYLHLVTVNLDKQRKRTHEFKNHIVCICELARKEKYNELGNYINELDNELSTDIDMVNTNNVIANAIINTKHREAMEKGIAFILKVNDSPVRKRLHGS